MLKRFGSCLLIWGIVAITGSASPARAEDLSQVTEKINAAWEGVKEIAAEVTVESYYPTGSTQSKGTLMYRRENDKIQARLDLVSLTEQLDDKNASSIKTSFLYDGAAVLMLAEEDQKPAIARRALPGLFDGMVLGGKPFLQQLAAVAELSLEGEEIQNDRPCYMITATITTVGQIDSPVKTARCWIDKATGVCLRLELGQPAEENWLTVSRTPIEPMPPIPEGYFDLKIPEGVVVDDLMPKSSTGEKTPATVPPSPEPDRAAASAASDSATPAP